MTRSLRASGGLRHLFVLVASLAVCALSVRESAAADNPSWSATGPTGGNVYCTAADPSQPATVYAGTERGVFKSVDGGASWTFTSAGLPPARVQAIAIDPSSPATLYAGTLTPNGVASVGIFKSTDGGATWTAANVGVFDPITGVGPVDFESVAVDPHNSNVVVAGGLFSELYRSGDAGASWQSVTFGGSSVNLQTTSIVFDPTTSANVYAASSSGLLKSADGGLTWVTFGNAGVPFFSLAIDPTQPHTLYAGDATGSGIWKSTDSGSHWATADVGLPGSGTSRPPVLALAVDPAHASTVYAATFGNGVWVSTNAGASWTAAASGMRDTRVASISLAAGQSSTIYAGTYGGGVYTSANGAQSWNRTSAGLDATLAFSLAFDPVSAGTIYTSTTDGVFATSDAGGTWREADSGLPSVSVATLAALPGASAKLLAGTLGSGLFQSADHGSTWTAATGLSDSYISSLAVDPTAPSTVYAGTAHPFTGSNSERIFKSTDGGATWRQTSLDAGQFTVDFIMVNPARASQVLAGSGGVSGLFQSLDGGTTWSPIATTCGGLASVAFDPSGSPIYAAGSAGVLAPRQRGLRQPARVRRQQHHPGVVRRPAGRDPASGGSGERVLRGARLAIHQRRHSRQQLRVPGHRPDRQPAAPRASTPSRRGRW